MTFEVVTNLARLIPRANDDTIDEVDAYIEWADPLLTESQEIVSTTIWNTLGSLCAMFLDVGESLDVWEELDFEDLEDLQEECKV